MHIVIKWIGGMKGGDGRDVDGGAFFPLGPQNAPQCGLVIM